MIELWIDGQPPRKSNNRRIVRRGRNGPPMSIKSQGALDWIRAANMQIPVDARQCLGSLERPLRIRMDIYYKSRRPDLSGELVLDLLQTVGVISDDRYVYAWELYKHFDKERPGIAIRVEYLNNDEAE